MGDGVAREIDDGEWGLGKEAVEEAGVTAGAGRVEDDGFVAGDEVKGVFGFGEDRNDGRWGLA